MIEIRGVVEPQILVTVEGRGALGRLAIVKDLFCGEAVGGHALDPCLPGFAALTLGFIATPFQG